MRLIGGPDKHLLVGGVADVTRAMYISWEDPASDKLNYITNQNRIPTNKR